jgi:hypothetical protein
MDCFVAALLAMTSNPDMHPRSRGADRPSFAKQFAHKTEGAGNAGRPTRPQPRVRCEMAHECSHHGHTGITRHSPRNGFTAYAVLSPATSSCCHRHPRIKVLPARSGRRASANLAPATGARTTRFCRTQKAPIILHAAHRSRGSSRPATAVARLTLSRPPHPAPRS